MSDPIKSDQINQMVTTLASEHVFLNSKKVHLEKNVYAKGAVMVDQGFDRLLNWHQLVQT